MLYYCEIGTERYKELNRESIGAANKSWIWREGKKTFVKLSWTDNVQSPAVVNALTERLQGNWKRKLTVATSFPLEEVDSLSRRRDHHQLLRALFFHGKCQRTLASSPVEKKFCFQSTHLSRQIALRCFARISETPKPSPLYALIRELQTSESEFAGSPTWRS